MIDLPLNQCELRSSTRFFIFIGFSSIQCPHTQKKNNGRLHWSKAIQFYYLDIYRYSNVSVLFGLRQFLFSVFLLNVSAVISVQLKDLLVQGAFVLTYLH